MEKVLCPHCGKEMEKKVFTDRAGQKSEIFICPKQGGFWFNRYGLYKISAQVGIELDLTEYHDSEERPEYQCSICKKKLKDFRDPYILTNLIFHRCEKCNGMWMFPGELRAYKQYQRAKEVQAGKEDDRVAVAWPSFLLLAGGLGLWVILESHRLNVLAATPTSSNYQQFLSVNSILFLVSLLAGPLIVYLGYRISQRQKKPFRLIAQPLFWIWLLMLSIPYISSFILKR
jgi:Zn-finger nucleic acid-binding protein